MKYMPNLNWLKEKWFFIDPCNWEARWVISGIARSRALSRAWRTSSLPLFLSPAFFSSSFISFISSLRSGKGLHPPVYQLQVQAPLYSSNNVGAGFYWSSLGHMFISEPVTSPRSSAPRPGTQAWSQSHKNGGWESGVWGQSQRKISVLFRVRWR